MKSNRVVRVIFGLIVLILFGAYSYLRAVNSPRSRDVAAPLMSVAPAASEEPVPSEEPAAPETTPEPTIDPDSPEGRAAALGLPAPPELDVTSWELMLVNAAHPLDPQDYAPAELTKLSATQCPVDSRIADALSEFAAGAEAEGLPVYLSSGYRAYSEQQYLYNRKISQGYSPEIAATIVAYPGTSEHQTGLCCDITDYRRETKDSSLAETATYKWLAEHCAEYGFIVRYPENKSGSADSVTGIIYEPWHFRYVGTEAAAYIMENGLCLEEFLTLYGVE